MPSQRDYKDKRGELDQRPLVKHEAKTGNYSKYILTYSDGRQLEIATNYYLAANIKTVFINFGDKLGWAGWERIDS